MTIALHSRLALPALLLAATGALAQPALPNSPDTRSATTRMEVRRQALEDLRVHYNTVVRGGEAAGNVAEVYPGTYAGMMSGRSRAEVAAELREAVRAGIIQPQPVWGGE